MNKGTRKNIISTIITLMIIGIGVVGFQLLSSKKTSTVSDKVVKKDRRKVDIKTFSPAEESNTIFLDGRLQAAETVNITSKVSGVLEPSSKSLRKGSYLKEGTLLFSVDSREARFNVQAAKSALMTSISQMMPDLKFDYPDAFEKWKSYLSEFDVEAPIKPFPKAQNDQEKYYVAGRNVYNQYYTIKSQETRLSDYQIYAPFSGVITQINLFPGSLVSPGVPLMTMINTSAYEVEATIPLEDLQYVRIGQSVELKSQGLDTKWTGKVIRIGSLIDEATQNIPVYISVYGQGLKNGMFLSGEMQGHALQNVIKLPKDIFVSPSTIYSVVDSTIVLKTIESIKRMDKDVLVRGLDPSDQIIVSSLSGLFEGQKVRY